MKLQKQITETYWNDKNQFKRVRFFPEEELFFKETSSLFRSLALESIKKRGVFHCAVSSGKAAALFYSYLGSYPGLLGRRWRRVHIWWTEERCVPQDNLLNNYGRCLDTFLRKVPVRDKNIHPLTIDTGSPKAAAESYAAEIKQTVSPIQGLPCFDLVILGLGKEGHTASLFPDRNYNSKSEIVFSVSRPPVEPRVPRVTFSLNLINNSRSVIFLSHYQGKEEAVDTLVAHTLQNAPAPAHPAAEVKPRNLLVFHILKP